MNKTLDLITLALATWRLSSYLSNEQGPNGIFEKLRRKVGIDYHPETGEEIPKNWLASDLACQWCVTGYVGLFFSLLYAISPKLAFYIALPFALSTGGILVMTQKTIQIYLRNLNK